MHNTKFDIESVMKRFENISPRDKNSHRTSKRKEMHNPLWMFSGGRQVGKSYAFSSAMYEAITSTAKELMK